VHHEDGGGCIEFNEVIPVAHSIDAIGRDPRKIQISRSPLHIDGQSCAGQRRTSQRQHIGALKTPVEAFIIPPEHLIVSHEMMRQQDGLGVLQMGEAGHDHIEVLLCHGHQDPLQFMQKSTALDEDVAQVKAHVEAYLIIAAPRRMKLATHFADLLDQVLLDSHVDVFLGGGEVDLVALDFSLDLSQSGYDPGGLFIGDDFAGCQHATVSNTSFNIIAIEPLVEMHRSGVLLHLFVHWLFKPPLPELFSHTSPFLIVTLDCWCGCV